MSQLYDNEKISAVISGGFCIGCGACSVRDSRLKITENEYGLYQAELNAASGDSLANSVCPFSAGRNEDDIGRSLFEMDSKFDSRVGFYKSIYAGYVSEGEYRGNGSSGGLVTWVLSHLMSQGEIDGVIHVGETGQVGNLFEYRISTTLDEIKNNAKSRYYPVHMNDILNVVKQSEGKYAFVGVPCFVKAVRLLAEQDEVIAEKIKFCISIFCGHFKTKAFSEMIAFQQGVAPSDLIGIDFRVKNPQRPANKYGVQISTVKEAARQKLAPIMTRDLYGMDWGVGYFKPRACDWCDDIAGETADLACGDAWLPEFVNDSGGTNIVIVRDKKIAELIQQGINNGGLVLSEQPVEKVYESQAGNYRHRQEGLSLRIAQAEKIGVWHPRKRIQAGSFDISRRRRKIYDLRVRISNRSHQAFLEAKRKNSFALFYMKMLPLELKYLYLNGGLIKGILKDIYIFLGCVLRRFL